MKYNVGLFVAFAVTLGLDRFLGKLTCVDGLVTADPITLGIAAIIITSVSTGYGVYAGERARSDGARQYQDSKNQAKEQRRQEQQQMAENEARQEKLFADQRAEQAATEERLRTEQSGAIERARGEVPGLQSKLGEDLLAQQERAYSRMAPQLEARLNALGLLQSGALPEAQAKAQGDLEARRQAALSDFGISASRELSIDRPLAASSADVERQYGGMQRNLETASRNLSQTFANQNMANQNQVAREQYLAGLDAARSAAAQASAGAYLNFAGQLGSGLLSYYGNRQGGGRIPYGKNTSVSALDAYRNKYAWGTDYSIPMTSGY